MKARPLRDTAQESVRRLLTAAAEVHTCANRAPVCGEARRLLEEHCEKARAELREAMLLVAKLDGPAISETKEP